MTIDLSVFMPAIRTQNWRAMYDSLALSCTKFSFELVLCSPFDLPEELKGYSNIKLIKDFGSPSRCAQLASFECEGDLLYHCVDDALFLPNSIDKTIYEYCGVYEDNNKLSLIIKDNKKTIVNMKYREGQNYSGQSMRDDYWLAYGHQSLRLAGINPRWKISLHHLLRADYFRELGGYDCEYEYQNFNLHDFIFRAQQDGATVYDCPGDATTCDHSQTDHGVIEAAHHQHDEPLFMKTYSNPDVFKTRPTHIDLNNWANTPPIWNRRFKGNETKYEDINNG